MQLNFSCIELRCKLFALVCQGLNVTLKSSIGGPFNLEGLEARPMMMVDKEAHGMKAFIGLGPIVIYSKC